MNKRKISVRLKKSSYHLDRLYEFVPVDVVKDLRELEIYLK